MPIRFTCPACRAAFTAADADAGKKAACPACHQRVQVPTPQRMKTVLGDEAPVLVPAAPPRRAAAPDPPAAPVPPPPPPAPAYQPPLVPLPSLPAPAAGRLTGAGLGLLAAVSVVVLVGVVVLVIGLAGRRARERDAPAATREPPRGERAVVVVTTRGRAAAATTPAGPAPDGDRPAGRLKGGRPGDPVLPIPPPVAPLVTGKVLTGEQVYQRLVHSAVLVRTEAAAGTGVVVDAGRRLVVTNQHVVGAAGEVQVLFPAYTAGGRLIADAREYAAVGADRPVAGEVLATDPACDLALVRVARVPADSGAAVLAPEPAGAGETVYSVGGSGAADNLLWRLTRGTVRGRAAKRPKVDTGALDCLVLETDAPVNRGDSGGPVVNDRGQLVAVVSYTVDGQRLVSGNIDVEEVRRFVARSPDR